MALEVNNHVHSTFSFSPYSPSDIPVKAKEAGLGTVGIMDHDSVSGCEEFLDACKQVNMAATIGFEMRVNMNGTAVEGRKTNNPDEPNVSYIAMHGIPRNQIAKVKEFLEPIHEARIARDRREVEKLNAVLSERGAPTLDFDVDVVAISEAANGGSITERHILYALSLKLIEVNGTGAGLVGFVENGMKVPLAGKLRELLLDPENPHYAYDLLGAFKSALVPEFFIPSDYDECISVYDAVKFGNEIGAIPAYAYLGDVGESPTGDKKAEKFEDDYLDVLVPELKKIGFKAITYMPPRNTREQLLRLQKLCQENDLMEISGVDINSSRQSFNCPILLEPEFSHLADAAWALIAHEKLSAVDPALSLFSEQNPMAAASLQDRVARYAEIGRKTDHSRPEEAIKWIGDL
ncbi:MAG: PHP domain-containing protein [Pontiellaceae bacterium]|nr:PHP domain-containing protein [Pontiellaceae bacterium]MBN2785311.1 PHP domain-containing protein [Pontiellaceae bacterium]